jgi:hypothetical protein
MYSQYRNTRKRYDPFEGGAQKYPGCADFNK